MRCLSLWQPWASLWLCKPKSRPRAKIHETRHWPAQRYGIRPPERILVHAAKTRNSEVRAILKDRGVRMILESSGLDPDNLPFGALIGAITITKSTQMSRLPVPDDVDSALGLWEPNRFAFRGEAPETFARPIPYRAVQTPFFYVDNSVLTPVCAGDINQPLLANL